jgi:hypothetical protein
VSTYLSALKRLKLFEFSKPKLSIGLYHFEERWAVMLFGLWITVAPSRKDPSDICDSWSFSYSADERAFFFYWGRWHKIFWAPWSWDHIDKAHLTLRRDGTWGPVARRWYEWGFDNTEAPDQRWFAILPYRYFLKNGTIQDRKALIHVERREWRWRSLPWLAWPRNRSQSICVAFSDEVGERTGSWKGGTVGCGYEMLPGESPEQALRRMEAERKFN